MYFVGGPRRWAMVLLSQEPQPHEQGHHLRPHLRLPVGRSQAISLFAVDYPADYLGDTVGSLAIAIRNGLVIHETPVTMYFRQTGRPSKNAIWSALYLGRATLAIIATSLKGGTRPGVTRMTAQILGAIAAIVTFVFVFSLLRRGVLREKYAVLWLLLSGAALFFAVFPGALKWISDTLGVETPANLLFFVTVVLLILVTVQLSYELSRHEARIRRLAEEVALLDRS